MDHLRFENHQSITISHIKQFNVLFKVVVSSSKHKLVTYLIASVSSLGVEGRVVLGPGVGLHQGARHALERPGQLGELGELARLGDGAESVMNQSEISIESH